MQTELAKDINARSVLSNLIEDLESADEAGSIHGQIGLNKEESAVSHDSKSTPLFKIPQMSNFETFSPTLPIN